MADARRSRQQAKPATVRALSSLGKLTTLKPRLATLAPRSNRLRTAEPKRLGSSKWAAVRDRILRRDEGTCQACLKGGRITLATEVDHRVPLWAHGTDDDDNLQSLCAPCHAEKTAAEAAMRAAGAYVPPEA